MSKTVQLKRGNANVSATYVGSVGEITVNTTDYTLNIHDGITPGGYVVTGIAGGNIGNINFVNQTISGLQSEVDITINPGNAQVIIQGNVSADYLLGNGSLITGLSTYSNADVISLFNNYGSPINSSGNITAGYFFGNGSTLSGLNISNIGNLRVNDQNLFGINEPSQALIIGRGDALGNVFIQGNVLLIDANIRNADLGNIVVDGTASFGDANMGNLTLGTLNAFRVYTANIVTVGFSNSLTGYTFAANIATVSNTGLLHREQSVTDPNVSVLFLSHGSPVAAFFSNQTSELFGNLVITNTSRLHGPFSNVQIGVYSNVNSYSQIIKQNLSEGTSASTDFVATANNGDDATFYVDLGIAGNLHADPDFFGDTTSFNDAYLYVTAHDQAGPSIGNIGNLIIGSTNGIVKTFIGNTAEANVVTVVDSTGFLPGANVQYSLGSADRQWKDLWVSNNTIYIDSVPISITANGTLTVNGSPVSGTSNIGNFVFDGNSLLNLNGGSYNNGDLSHGYTASMILPVNGTNDPVQLLNTYGNLTISSGSNSNISGTWTFDNNGDLTVPNYIKFQGNTLIGDEPGSGTPEFRITAPLGYQAIIQTDSDISGNNWQWTFGVDGNLTLAGASSSAASKINSVANSSGDGNGYTTLGLIPDSSLIGADQYIIIDPTAPGHIHIRAGGTQDDSNAELIIGGENSNFKIGSGANASASISANSYSWTFGTDGTIAPPVLNVTRGDVSSGTLSGFTFNIGNGSNEAILTTPDGDATGFTSSQRLVINPGKGADGTSGEGGDIYLWGGRGGDTGGSGGDIKIRGGQGMLTGDGGYIRVEGGDAQGSGTAGYITLDSGQGVDSVGGYIRMRGGYSSNNGGGYAQIQGGYGANGDGGEVSLVAGGSDFGQSRYGNIRLQSGSYQWNFNNQGNLIFPDSSVQTTAYPGTNVSLVLTGNLTVGNLTVNGNATYINTNSYVVDDNIIQMANANPADTLDIGFTGHRTVSSVLQHTGLVRDASADTWKLFSNVVSQPGTTVDFTNAVYDAIQTGNITAPYFFGNASQLSSVNAETVDILNTNGLTTVFYPTFVENRDSGEILRADVDLSYRTDTNTLTVGNVSATYFIGNGSLLTGITGGSGNYSDSNVSTFLGSFGSNTIVTTGNITGGNIIAGATSAHRWATGNAQITINGGTIQITPDTGINALAGVSIGGNGYILAPNNARNITLNYNGGSGVVGLQANVQIGAGGGGGTLFVPGTISTGANAIVAGVTNTILPNTLASYSASINSYSQVTVQNKSTGADATADLILTADNGSDTVNYADFGIINSGYDNATPTNSLGNIVYAADTYLYAQGNSSASSQSGGNLAIGTTVAGKTVKIFAGGANASSVIATVSNTGVAINGNVTANNIIGTSPNVSLVAGNYTWTFDSNGNAAFANGNVTLSGNISGNVAGFAIGYRDIPQIALSANSNVALTDAGKHYYSTTAGNLTLTLVDNSNVALPVGATMTIVVNAAGNVVVTQGTGVTLYMAGSSTTGNKVVGAYGMASVMKVAANTWVINGTGVY